MPVKRRVARSWGSKRQTLKQHLTAQWRRGQGNPKERTGPLPRWMRKKRGDAKEHTENPAPGTRLGDVWPE